MPFFFPRCFEKQTTREPGRIGSFYLAILHPLWFFVFFSTDDRRLNVFVTPRKENAGVFFCCSIVCASFDDCAGNEFEVFCGTSSDPAIPFFLPLPQNPPSTTVDGGCVTIQFMADACQGKHGGFSVRPKHLSPCRPIPRISLSCSSRPARPRPSSPFFP